MKAVIGLAVKNDVIGLAVMIEVVIFAQLWPFGPLRYFYMVQSGIRLSVNMGMFHNTSFKMTSNFLHGNVFI